MAKLWYEPRAGGAELQVWNDPQILDLTSTQNELATIGDVRSFSDFTRAALAQGGIPTLGISGGWPDLGSFDGYLNDEYNRLSDVLDYFAYDSRIENLTVRDGAWYTPEAIEDVSGENVGEEAVLSIDAINTNWWQFDGAADITFRVRDYKKTITGFRLRTTAGDLKAQIQGVDIYASQGLTAIDDPANLLDAGVDFTYAASVWMEHVLPSKKRAKYLKLVIPDSLDGADVRIREIQVRVGITNHDK